MQKETAESESAIVKAASEGVVLTVLSQLNNSKEDRIETPLGCCQPLMTTSTPASTPFHPCRYPGGLNSRGHYSPRDRLPCCFHDVTIGKRGRKPWAGRVRNNG